MKSKHLIALAVLAVSTAASAQNLYGVVSAGVSKLSFDCGTAPSCDKTDTAFKLLGGYKFAPNWAGEIGYMDFGKAKLSGGGANLDIKVNGFGGGVAYHQDIAPAWNFVARLGIAQMKTKLSGSAPGIGSASESDSNIEPYLGLGVGYKLSKTVSIDGAFDYSKGKFNKLGIDESGNANAFSVGLTFGF
jgi:OOP family OmpA-OmpF porin